MQGAGFEPANSLRDKILSLAPLTRLGYPCSIKCEIWKNIKLMFINLFFHYLIMELPFQLQEGEKILKETKPLPAYKTSLFFTNLVIVFIFVISGLSVFVPLILMAAEQTWSILFWSIIPVILVSLILSWWLASMMYKKRHYWITNKRAICKTGIIGYSVSSVPLERISDIIITRSWWENLFGYGSLYCQSLAGQMGREIRFNAMPEPEETQKFVFELVKKKRKDENITF